MPTTDPITGHARKRVTEFAATLLEELGADDAYEDDEERLFALLVTVAEAYVDRQTESGSLGFPSAIGATVDGLAENLEIVFHEELNR